MSPLVCYCRKYNISNGASRGVVVHMKEIGNKEYKNITKDTLLGTSWTEQKTGSNPDHRKGIFLSVQSPPEEYWLVRMGQQRRVGWYDRKRTADGSTGD